MRSIILVNCHEHDSVDHLDDQKTQLHLNSLANQDREQAREVKPPDA